MTTTRLVFAGLAAVSLAVAAPASTFAGEEKSEESEAAAPSTSDDDAPPTWLGVEIADDPAGPAGAECSRVLDGTPADEAGLREGDVILRAAGTEVDDLESLKSELAPHGPGATVTLAVVRDGETREVEVTLEEKPTKRELIDDRVVGERPDSFELSSLGGGEPVAADELRGKPTVLEFWATWCYPCRRTAETMEKVVDRHGDTVRVIGVSAESARKLRVYRREESPSYDIRRDPDREAHAAFLVDTLPTVVVLDGEGRVSEVFRGAEHREAILQEVDRLTPSSNSQSDSESK